MLIKVGDTITGYSRVQRRKLTGVVTAVTPGDKTQTYELGYGNWVSKLHPITLVDSILADLEIVIHSNDDGLTKLERIRAILGEED